MKIFLCEYFKVNDIVAPDLRMERIMALEQKKTMSRSANFIAAGFALAVYIIGGLAVMTGLGLIGILGAEDRGL